MHVVEEIQDLMLKNIKIMDVVRLYLVLLGMYSVYERRLRGRKIHCQFANAKNNPTRSGLETRSGEDAQAS